MKILLSLVLRSLLAIVMCVAPLSQAETFGVGQKEFNFEDKKRGRKLAARVWYPVNLSVKMEVVAERGPFVPVVVAKDAALAKASSRYPIVLLSHGSGGKAERLFWLAEPLVRNGFVVLGVDHPGNKLGDNSADGLLRVWDRPQDLSLALDRLLETAEFKDHLDATRVVAAGHSAGGATVMLLGGARLDARRFASPVPNCGGTKDPYFAELCEQMNKLELKKYSSDVVQADYTDKRVKAFVGLDPGFARSFDPHSLKTLPAKALVLVAEKLNSPHDEIYAKDFMKLMPTGSAKIIRQSYHFTFLTACRPSLAIKDPDLKELCVDNDRKIKIQKDVAQQTLKFFRAALK